MLGKFCFKRTHPAIKTLIQNQRKHFNCIFTKNRMYLNKQSHPPKTNDELFPLQLFFLKDGCLFYTWYMYRVFSQGVQGPEEWLVEGIEAAQLTAFSSWFSPGSSSIDWIDVHFLNLPVAIARKCRGRSRKWSRSPALPWFGGEDQASLLFSNRLVPSSIHNVSSVW